MSRKRFPIASFLPRPIMVAAEPLKERTMQFASSDITASWTALTSAVSIAREARTWLAPGGRLV